MCALFFTFIFGLAIKNKLFKLVETWHNCSHIYIAMILCFLDRSAHEKQLPQIVVTSHLTFAAYLYKYFLK